MIIREITAVDRPWLDELVATEWGLPLVSISGEFDPAKLPGFIAEEAGERLGALTYYEDASAIEVISLNSVAEGRGVGSALLRAARELAAMKGVRLWLITSNENLHAIRFYQRQGMDMVALHRDFADTVRRAKPGIEFQPVDGIVFRHALEFEYPAP